MFSFSYYLCVPARLALLANEIFVLGNLSRFEANTVKMEPQLAHVALHPVNLKKS